MIRFFFHPKPIRGFFCRAEHLFRLRVRTRTMCGCYLSVINYVIKQYHPGVNTWREFICLSIYCKCECVSSSYLIAVGLVPDELEAWNALLGAHHSDIF